MNPDLRVSVKVPVVPNVGTIGLGIAKAGADIITLSGLRGRHRRRAPARPAPRRPAVRHRHPGRAPRADGGRDPQPGRDLGRRRLPPRPRHREAPLHGRQPGRLRHPGDGLAGLHDLPRLPARHLPRRHRDPDRDRRAGARSTGSRSSRRSTSTPPPRAAPASSRRWARRSSGSSPSSATSAPRTSSAATTCSSRSRTQSELDLAELITPLEEFLDLEPIDLPVAEEELVAEARAEAGPGARAADPHGAEGGLHASSRGSPGRSSRARPVREEYPAPDRRPRPRARHRARRGDLARPDLRRRRRRATRSTCSPSSTSTAARSPARASAPSTPGAWWSGSRAAPRTASARRCSAGPSRS